MPEEVGVSGAERGKVEDCGERGSATEEKAASAGSFLPVQQIFCRDTFSPFKKEYFRL